MHQSPANPSLMTSMQILLQALGLRLTPTVTKSYVWVPFTPEDAPLTARVNADVSHVAVILVGDPQDRDMAIRIMEAAFPGGDIVADTAYGPVTGRFEADPHGNRFAIARWSFPKAGIRFSEDEGVEKSVARGLLMTEIVRKLTPYVLAANAAARARAAVGATAASAAPIAA